jgi:hypothetical protein
MLAGSGKDGLHMLEGEIFHWKKKNTRDSAWFGETILKLSTSFTSFILSMTNTSDGHKPTKVLSCQVLV